MKSFQTEVKEYTEKVRLKVAERRELRERILSYMEYHPLPKKREKIIEIPSGIVSEPFKMIRVSPFHIRLSIGVFAVLFFVIIPVAAERALPGDVLYLVKTEVNESIRGNFADSPYEKVEYETKLIERRIAEARLLASEGKLTNEVEAQIVKTVKTHANAAQNGIAKIREQNADDAAMMSIAFDSALQVQSAVLDVEKTKSESNATSNIIDAVKNVREEVAANQGTTSPSYDAVSARVERETSRAIELFESVKTSATSEEVANIERRISDIDRKIVRAQAVHGRGEDGAIPEFTEALSLLQKLIVFMTDIDVRETVMLETLVPVVPTLEERIESLQILLPELSTLLARIEERTLTIEDTSVLEKVELGTQQVKELLVTATSTLNAEPVDIDTAEEKIHEAEALLRDLDTLTSSSEEPETPIENPTDVSNASTTPEEKQKDKETPGRNRDGRATSPESIAPITPVEPIE